MPIRVDYKKRIGYFTATEKRADGVRKFRIHICHANCLCAMMYFYKNEDGEDMAQLYAFFHDMPHAKRCFKDDVFLADWDNFVFNAKELNNDLWKFIRLLADNGKKVTIK